MEAPGGVAVCRCLLCEGVIRLSAENERERGDREVESRFKKVEET